MSEFNINVSGEGNTVNVGGQQQLSPTAARWVLVCAVLFNPWAWLLGVILWVTVKPLVIIAGIVWVVYVVAKHLETQKVARQRALDKTALRAEVESEYWAKGDDRGTYGQHLPPEELR